MNTYFINDEKLKNSDFYQEFIKSNPGKGNIGNNKVIFFDGVTDSSGMIQTLSLPTPSLEISNLEIPVGTIYYIEADNITYSVNLYDGICVVQNINTILGGNNG